MSDAGIPRGNASAYANGTSPHRPSTAGGRSMTHRSVADLLGIPGGQLMTPGTSALDVLSPAIDIEVNLRRSPDDNAVGIVREVFQDGSCKVVLGTNGYGETIIVLPSEIDVVVPNRLDMVKIMSGEYRGTPGKLLGLTRNEDAGVKLEDGLGVKMFDMAILAKLAMGIMFPVTDIVVNFRQSTDDDVGVIREILQDDSCKVALGTNGDGEMTTVHPSEIQAVVPNMLDKIKIIGGAYRGTTGKLIGKLIGVANTGVIVRFEDGDSSIKVLDMAILAKHAPP